MPSFPIRSFLAPAAILALASAAYGAAISQTGYSAAALAESWEIPEMKVHFMGANSGIGDGSWPPGTEFNSTIEFELDRYATQQSEDSAPGASVGETTCGASWVEGELPTEWIQCGDAKVEWKMVETSEMSETDFTMEVRLMMTDSETVEPLYAEAQTRVTANTRGSPSSYLTCLGSEPFDGIRCEMDGIMSTPGPIKLSPVM
ncbi:hypothetical protein BDY21DRAFT_371009 [Lineolata rhizophorae]|uniref:Uncharacterized protein n=1 Tax=Lineolata rhizophorae TaxID=578093 RepID=A0A6A6P2Q1_9PEZI|nr:hypothetical protein BDY21DRAFT_371009 [Lineolata rhizophorae]